MTLVLQSKVSLYLGEAQRAGTRLAVQGLRIDPGPASVSGTVGAEPSPACWHPSPQDTPGCEEGSAGVFRQILVPGI